MTQVVHHLINNLYLLINGLCLLINKYPFIGQQASHVSHMTMAPQELVSSWVSSYLKDDYSNPSHLSFWTFHSRPVLHFTFLGLYV
jgi:hypothetical protein